MIDKLFQKTEESITRLNQTLTLFENDFDRLKGKFDGEFVSFRSRVEAEIINFRSGIEGILNETKEKVQKVQTDSQDLLKDHSSLLDDLIKSKIEAFEKAALLRLEILSKSADESVGRLKKLLVDQYEAMEQKARDDSQKAFETDVEGLFSKYGDKIAPHMFKSLMSYVFRFGRKK